MARIEDLRKKSILDVAHALGMELKRVGSDRYVWKEHDSFVITPSRNFFKWFSQTDKYGDVFKLVQVVREEQTGQKISFKQAKHFLEEGTFSEVDLSTIQPKLEPFRYFLDNQEHINLNFTRDYFKRLRGLSDDTINFFINDGKIAEANYGRKGNSELVIVFKYQNHQGQLVGASLQGILENRQKHPERGRLKQIMKNSDGMTGFSIDIGKPERLIFAESPIDLMSYYELHRDTLQNVRLVAMDGLKEGLVSRRFAELVAEMQGKTYEFDPKKTSQFLAETARITTFFEKEENKNLITLAVDNDEAGHRFISNLQNEGIPIQIEIPPITQPGQDKEDWNDYLKKSIEPDNSLQHVYSYDEKNQTFKYEGFYSSELAAEKVAAIQEKTWVTSTLGQVTMDQLETIRKEDGIEQPDTVWRKDLPENIQEDLSIEGNLVGNLQSDGQTLYTQVKDIGRGYRLELTVYSPEMVDSLEDTQAPWTVAVIKENQNIGYLAYGSDWGNEFQIADELERLGEAIQTDKAADILYKSEEVEAFLENGQSKIQVEVQELEKGTKKALDVYQELTSDAGEFHRTSDYLGENSPRTASQPVVDEPQPNFPAIAQLQFTTDGVRVSNKKPGYQVIDDKKLHRLNRFAPTLQTAAQWYLKELADSKISYVFASTNDEKEIIQINFQKKNFAHLAGISPVNRTMEETLDDLAYGRGHFDNILLSDANKDKMKVLPLLPDIIEAGTFVFNDLSEVKKLHNIDMSKAISPDDTDLLVLFRNTAKEGMIPASLMRIKGKLGKNLKKLDKQVVLGVFRERNGSIELLSINDDYIKDGGKEMFETLKRSRESEILKEELDKFKGGNKLMSEFNQRERERDTDGDGLANEFEQALGRDPYSPDNLHQGNAFQEEPAKEFPQKSVKELIQAMDKKGLAKVMKEGVKDYFQSDTYKKFLETMSKFHNYSPRNIQLLLLQNPEVSHVASSRKWEKDFERIINKGEKALRVLAPITVKRRDPKTKEVLKDKEGKDMTYTSYKLVPVFDVSQTNGKELPKPAYQIEGTHQDYANLYRAAKEVAQAKGVSIEISKEDMKENGYYSLLENKIVIKAGMSEQHTLKTIFHEMAHMDLHNLGKMKTNRTSRTNAELQAESVAFVVASHYGFDTSSYSFAYLASWTDEPGTLADLEAQISIVQKEASDLMQRIDSAFEKYQNKELAKDPLATKLEQLNEKQQQEILDKEDKENEKKSLDKENENDQPSK